MSLSTSSEGSKGTTVKINNSPRWLMLHLHLLLQPELQVEWSALSHTDLIALQNSGLSSGLVPALCWVSLL